MGCGYYYEIRQCRTDPEEDNYSEYVTLDSSRAAIHVGDRPFGMQGGAVYSAMREEFMQSEQENIEFLLDNYRVSTTTGPCIAVSITWANAVGKLTFFLPIFHVLIFRPGSHLRRQLGPHLQPRGNTGDVQPDGDLVRSTSDAIDEPSSQHLCYVLVQQQLSLQLSSKLSFSPQVRHRHVPRRRQGVVQGRRGDGRVRDGRRQPPHVRHAQRRAHGAHEPARVRVRDVRHVPRRQSVVV